MTLLEQINRQRFVSRERLRLETRGRLREVLRLTIPGQRVLVFGSLIRPGKFNEQSDIDLALESEPGDMSIYQLISLLSERMGRRVDVMLLDECRFRERILKEGELWIPQD
jgi:predicted nucleotidyltransferase